MGFTYAEARVRQSEVLQLLLLDGLFGHSGSQHLIFQGGTALRWVYGGSRFSEDLDFVSHLSPDRVELILKAVFRKVARACAPQFGAGQSEERNKSVRGTAWKTFFIYRPVSQQERIAVKLEFESPTEQTPSIPKVCFEGPASGVSAYLLGPAFHALFQRRCPGGNAGGNPDGQNQGAL